MRIPAPTLFESGEVLYWSVYQQVWIKSNQVSDSELACMRDDERAAVIKHLEDHQCH